MQVFIVGETLDETGRQWQILGIFSSREKAIVACTKPSHWIGMMKLDERLPDEIEPWPDDEFAYPLLEKKESA